MKNLLSKIETVRFLKKTILFCFGYIIAFTVTMIVIYFIKGDYPETLATLTFAFFSIEAVVSAVIKIFEPIKKKQSDESTLPIIQEEFNGIRHNPDNQ